MAMLRRRWTFALLAFIATSLVLQSCESTWEKRQEQKRRDHLATLRQKISGQFLIATTGYVAVVLLGPSVAESLRQTTVRIFRLSRRAQLLLANGIYWAVMATILLLSFIAPELSEARPAVWILIAATAYPFYCDFVPSLSTEDKSRRKAAASQIKSLLMLIVVIFVILHLFTPEGVGPIQLK